MRLPSQLSRMNCQRFSTGLSSGERAGSGSRVMLSGTASFVVDVPAGLIEQQHGVGAGGDGRGDLFEVQGHRLGVAAGHDEAGALALGRADRPEDVGRGGALVLGGRGRVSALGPAPGERVLLADPGLVCEPDLYRLAADSLRDLRQAGGEVFLKADRRPDPGRDGADGPRACGSPWPAAPGSASARRPTRRDPRTGSGPDRTSRQRTTPCAAGVGPLLDQRAQRLALLGVQARTGARRLAVDQPVRAIGVEGHDPVAHRLQPDPADLGRLRARDRPRQIADSANRRRVWAGSREPLARQRKASASKSDRSGTGAAIASSSGSKPKDRITTGRRRYPT